MTYLAAKDFARTLLDIHALRGMPAFTIELPGDGDDDPVARAFRTFGCTVEPQPAEHALRVVAPRGF